MSPVMHMAPLPSPYTPTSDAMDRHEYGVTKNRKVASTGGGRAWSEDEEVYLLQTRLQKMPYKHIAAHLKKTELACRLHYHQLSHGSNRRKRTTSVSSGSSPGHSPILPASHPSPVHESASRSTSPTGSATYVPASPANSVQLPSLMEAANVTAGSGHRLPTILPKPASMTLPPRGTSPPGIRGYPTPLPEPHSAVLAPANFTSLPPHRMGSHSNPSTPPLHLDCSVGIHTPTHQHAHVDMARLNAIYSAHRATFWAAVAADYGSGANPASLEQAWKAGNCCAQHHQSTPITPVSSPENGDRDGAFGKMAQDKTRISAILGIDANPRSPREREMVRRMEEERSVVA